MNTHGLTGAPLQQPGPPPLRKFAVFDKDDPCTEHSCGYTGKVPLTGDYQCALCHTAWDEQGNALPPRAEQPHDKPVKRRSQR